MCAVFGSGNLRDALQLLNLLQLSGVQTLELLLLMLHLLQLLLDRMLSLLVDVAVVMTGVAAVAPLPMSLLLLLLLLAPLPTARHPVWLGTDVQAWQVVRTERVPMGGGCGLVRG